MRSRKAASACANSRSAVSAASNCCVEYTSVGSGEVIKRLERDGWMPRKGKGSHRVFTHPTKTGIVVVPHPRKDLMVGTLRNIYRQAGWGWGGR